MWWWIEPMFSTAAIFIIAASIILAVVLPFGSEKLIKMIIGISLIPFSLFTMGVITNFLVYIFKIIWGSYF